MALKAVEAARRAFLRGCLRLCRLPRTSFWAAAHPRLPLSLQPLRCTGMLDVSAPPVHALLQPWAGCQLLPVSSIRAVKLVIWDMSRLPVALQLGQ